MENQLVWYAFLYMIHTQYSTILFYHCVVYCTRVHILYFWKCCAAVHSATIVWWVCARRVKWTHCAGDAVLCSVWGYFFGGINTIQVHRRQHTGPKSLSLTNREKEDRFERQLIVFFFYFFNNALQIDDEQQQQQQQQI